MSSSERISDALHALSDAQRANDLKRFFKCEPGEYGEGDRFLGIRVPDVREIVTQNHRDATLDDVNLLTLSSWHEERLAGFMLLIQLYKSALKKEQSQTHTMMDFYFRIIERGNNWDLVDLVAPYLLGDYMLRFPDHALTPMMQLSMSGNLWKERVAIVAHLPLIRKEQFESALEQCSIHLKHSSDLIHKAIGWVLREVGKKDKEILIAFIEKNLGDMHSTTLRYAIEKMPLQERQQWLQKKRDLKKLKKRCS